MKVPPLQTVYAALRNHRQITRVQVCVCVCITEMTNVLRVRISVYYICHYREYP